MPRILCHADDIPEGGARGFAARGGGVFAIKRGGVVHLYRNRCPHMGTELEWEPDDFLDPTGRHIQCSTHGAIFRIEDGYCTEGPCAGQSLETVPYALDEAGNIVLDGLS